MLNEKNLRWILVLVPLALMSILIDGEVNVEGKCSLAVLTMSGLVTYNTRKLWKPSSRCLNHRHHNKERETSVTIYVGFKFYSEVRSRIVIDYLFSLAIWISYGRILTFTKSIYDVLHKSCARHWLFLPVHLRNKFSIILVKDYIHKNGSANLAHSYYHGIVSFC